MKNIFKFSLFLGGVFFVFEFVTENSFYYIADSLYQPKNMKGVLKVAIYSFSYFFILTNLVLLFLLKKGWLFSVTFLFASLALILDSSYYFNGFNRGFSSEQFVTAVNESRFIVDAVVTFYVGSLKSVVLFTVFAVLVWMLRTSIDRRFLFMPVLLLPFTFVGGYFVMQESGDDSIQNYPSYVKVPVSVFNALNRGLLDIPYTDRDDVKAQPVNTPLYKNILWIVDESVRGDYLSINGYEENTTPFLLSVENILSFGAVSSVANNSASSNYILRNGVAINELPDKNFSTLKKPTIFQYAKKAGFKTLFLDAQSGYGALQNNMSYYDLKDIDHFVTLQEKKDYALLDRNMVKELSHLINDSNDRHFTYFVKYGSHFKWQLNYPKSDEYFKPSLTIYDSLNADNREKAVNTYRNSVRWGVDSFFEFLLKEIDTKDTLIIYTADHGQNIVENEMIMTHGVVENSPSEMANVPLFMYADDIGIVKSKLGSLVKPEGYSQYQIFPTLLDLMGYETETVRQYGIPLWEPYGEERKFYSGSIFGTGYQNSFDKK